jgi:hypothetical protein
MSLPIMHTKHGRPSIWYLIHSVDKHVSTSDATDSIYALRSLATPTVRSAVPGYYSHNQAHHWLVHQAFFVGTRKARRIPISIPVVTTAYA